MTTIDDIIELLKPNDGWYLSWGYLRRPATVDVTWNFCPVTYAASVKTGKLFAPFQYSEAAKAMGMDLNDANAVALAADVRKMRLVLRARLLEAAGLREEW